MRTLLRAILFQVLLAAGVSFAAMSAAAATRLAVSLPPASELAVEDAAREAAGLPWRYAVPEAVRATVDRDGAWERHADGSRSWRFEVASPGALSINLGFTVFWLPSGATLTLRGGDKDAVPVVFDASDNADHGELWTPAIPGDRLLLELAVPTGAGAEPLLELGSVNSGYRFFGEHPALKSGACNVDVVCAEGDDWRAEIASVGLVSVGGSHICTGAMVNNTGFDRTPYFLTANHCSIDALDAPSVVIYWNFESPVCGQHGGGSLSDFTSGSTLRATWSGSDFTLLELDEQPDPAFGVTWAGWNRAAAVPTSATAIHHPDSDEKSISFENDPLQAASYLEFANPGNGTHLRVIDWDLGTTEPGSSGSPLFDQDHLVVGQLHGGWAACGNNDSDWYGRLHTSWTGGGTAATRLSDWLDPGATGVESVPLLDPAAGEFTVSPSGNVATGGPVGGPFAATAWEFTLANAGDTEAQFAATSDRTWATASPASGTVPAGGQVTVTLALAEGAAALPVGRHTAVLALANPRRGDEQTRTLTVDIVAPTPTLVGLGPNPFRDEVSVRVSLPVAGELAWRIHDLRGRIVRHAVAQMGIEGENVIVWDGRDDGGRRVPSGAYVLTFTAGGHDVRVQVVCGH